MNVPPATVLLAQVEQAERLRRAERAYRVTEALAAAPARRRWPPPLRFRRPEPRPAGPDGHARAPAGAHPGGLA
jgi:hypothetical protein